MTPSTLLVRVAGPDALGQPVTPPKGRATLVCERLGETVIFAHSDVPGIWSCFGRGRFRRLSYRLDGVVMEFDRVAHFARPVVTVIAAEDALETPYAFDELSFDEVERIDRLAWENENQEVFPAFAERAQEALQEALYERAPAYEADEPGAFIRDGWLDRLVPSDSDLYDSALERYGNRCAITGLPLSMPGGFREGFVVPAHFRGAVPRAVCDVMPITGTLAFCYAHGLVAATEGLTLWLHPLLPLEIATLVGELNPSGRLNVPEAPQDWPRPELLRRHLGEAQA